MTALERRKLFCSVTFHIVAITCVIWSLYVLIDRTYQEIRDGEPLQWPFWTKLIVVAIGFTGGLVFMYIQCKVYVHLCKKWKAYNRIIVVQVLYFCGQKVLPDKLFRNSINFLVCISGRKVLPDIKKCQNQTLLFRSGSVTRSSCKSPEIIKNAIFSRTLRKVYTNPRMGNSTNPVTLQCYQTSPLVDVAVQPPYITTTESMKLIAVPQVGNLQ